VNINALILTNDKGYCRMKSIKRQSGARTVVLAPSDCRQMSWILSTVWE